MRIRTAQSSDRAFVMVYGSTGVGKTASSLQSVPRRTLYLQLEPRPVERACEGVIDDWDEIDIGHPEDFLDLFNYLKDNYNEIIEKYNSVVVDSFSFLMNVTLLGDIEAETGEAQVFEKKNRPLVNMGRTDITGYGSLSSLMKRLCKILGRIASEGLIVVVTALQADNPKWNRELAAGPALAGKEFPRDMPGYFDLIGRAESRLDEEGNPVYPPKIYFRSDEEESFLAKWSGPPLEKPALLLDWQKILAKGKKEVGKKSKK